MRWLLVIGVIAGVFMSLSRCTPGEPKAQAQRFGDSEEQRNLLLASPGLVAPSSSPTAPRNAAGRVAVPNAPGNTTPGTPNNTFATGGRPIQVAPSRGK